MIYKIIYTTIFCFISLKNIAQTTKDTLINFYYNTNEYKLNENQKSILQFIKTKNFTVKKINAFTDSIGTVNYNKILSLKRANEVKLFFEINSINVQEINSYGKEHIQSNNLSQNRRVDLYCLLNIETKINTKERVIKDTLELILKDVNFVPNSPEIEYESTFKLPNIVEQLKKLKPIKIVITGHCNLGSKTVLRETDFFYKLSQARALTIFEYLKDNGISSETMEYKGLGNTVPLFINPKNENEARQNMRVMIKVFY